MRNQMTYLPVTIYVRPSSGTVLGEKSAQSWSGKTWKRRNFSAMMETILLEMLRRALYIANGEVEAIRSFAARYDTDRFVFPRTQRSTPRSRAISAAVSSRSNTQVMTTTLHYCQWSPGREL